MSRSKPPKRKPSKKPIRPVNDYIAAARELAKLIPALRKYKRRKTLSPQEKGAITLKEKAMKGLYNLQPVTPKQAKWLKRHDLLVTGEVHSKYKSGPRKGQPRVVTVRGINAIQLSNTGESVKLEIVSDNLMVTTNGRTWVYQRIEMANAEEMLEDGYEPEEITAENADMLDSAGKQVFKPSIREAFPVEKIIRLAEKAFKNPTVKLIGLWTTKGRAGEAFANIKEFTRWVYKDFSSYTNVERWVNGIAALIADVNDPIPYGAWRKDTKAARRQRERRKKLARLRKRASAR